VLTYVCVSVGLHGGGGEGRVQFLDALAALQLLQQTDRSASASSGGTPVKVDRAMA
jgi:hypothetical protein